MVYQNRIKKRVAMIAAIVLIFNSSKGQTFNEWFRQKETQKKYLLKQIAALQIYAGYVEKGYDIVHDGSKLISEIKKGDLNIHSAYFTSLQNVNAIIKKDGRVPEIIQVQLQIVTVYNTTIKSVTNANNFSEEEIKYCKSVFSKLINQSLKIINDLIRLTTSGKLEMKDNERLERIESLYNDIQDKLAFAQSFSREAELLTFQRRKEASDINKMRSLYQVK